MKKYKLVRDSSSDKSLENLLRVVALRTFGTGENTVTAGERGGWVQSERNLSHDGNCWIREEACVRDYAKVLDDAIVAGAAYVADRAIVDGKALVQGAASVLDDARVGERAVVDGQALIRDSANVGGQAMVCGSAVIKENAIVRGLAHVHGDALIAQHTLVDEDVSISSRKWLNEGHDARKIKLREIVELANSHIIGHKIRPAEERLLFLCGIIGRITCESRCGLTFTLDRAHGRINATASQEVLAQLSDRQEDPWVEFEDLGSLRVERISPGEILESKIQSEVPGYTQLPDWARDAVRNAYQGAATQFNGPVCQNKLNTAKELLRDLREKAKQVYGC